MFIEHVPRELGTAVDTTDAVPQSRRGDNADKTGDLQEEGCSAFPTSTPRIPPRGTPVNSCHVLWLAVGEERWEGEVALSGL